MKTRILSLVLAVIMVVSMAAVFSVSASAEDPAITVTVGNAYIGPDETEANVDLYVYVDAMPEGKETLRAWQFGFSQDIVGKDALVPYASGGGLFGTANESQKQYMFTVDSGYNCGTTEVLTGKGGFKIATLGFKVPEGLTAGDSFVIDIPTIVTVSLGDADGKNFVNYADYATVVPGTVYIVETADADAVVGEGEDLYVKAIVGGKLVAIDEDTYTGEFGNVYIDAMINAAFVDNFMGDAENFIIKDAAFDDLMGLVDGNGVYYHKLAVGDTPIIDNYDGLSAKNKKKVTFFKNLLQVVEAAPVVIGNEVTFVFGIAAKDVWYSDLTIVVEVEGGKTYEKTVTGVYNTLVRGGVVLATNSETVAAADESLEALDLGFLSGLTLVGAPAGDYTATVTLYGTTPNASGTPVVVCSDAVEVTFTVA